MKTLRCGFSTGSAAAAGAKAGLLYYFRPRDIQQVDIPLPNGQRLEIPIECIQKSDHIVTTTVIKDGGDDPDVTHKARLRVGLSVFLNDGPSEIIIKGGSGVGQVTKPGLPVEVGKTAINPSPKEQIRKSVLEVLDDYRLRARVTVTISIDNGLALSKKTLNPRLGIVGGLSILGTSGLVQPYSCQAYQETISAALDVAKASKSSVVALNTGGKSEHYLKNIISDLPEECFVQIADFFSFSLKQIAQRGFQTVLIGCFFGKLVKMAQGYGSTHAKSALIDFDRLASWTRQAGLDGEMADCVALANTAREVLSLIGNCQQWDKIVKLIASKALQAAQDFAGQRMDVNYYLFDFQGNLLHFQK